MYQELLYYGFNNASRNQRSSIIEASGWIKLIIIALFIFIIKVVDNLYFVSGKSRRFMANICKSLFFDRRWDFMMVKSINL
jgi:hypothetical protein